MPFSDEQLEQALQHFISRDRARAEKGFTVLREEAIRMLTPSLLRIVCSRGIEDVLQDVLIKFWNGRETYRYMGVPQWRKYMKVMATHCAFDWIKVNDPPPDNDGGEQVAPPDTGGDRSIIDKLAGEVWFGYHEDLSLRERDRRVLAAQLHYENGLEWRQICEMVNGRDATSKDREALDSWLQDKAVLRDMAFRALYRSGLQIVQYVLQLEEPTDMLDVLREAVEGKGMNPIWSDAEVVAIIWRYGFDLLREQILRREDNKLTPKELQALCDRCDGCLPFTHCMQELIEAMGTLSQEVFDKENGVLKRLAFEYGYRDRLPQKDILTRLGPAAELVSYRLTIATLNMWISGQRLLKELKKGMWDE